MNDDLQELPEEVRAEILRPETERQEVLVTLGRTLATMRDEAVQARKDSGIEDTWLDCEEAYLGIDDENRAEFMNARWAKPMTMDGPLIAASRSNSSDQVKATAFLNETRRYVNAGAAKVCEISLPIDGKPFTLKATPVPEMSAAKDDARSAEQVTGQPMPGPDGQPVTVGDLASHAITVAETKAEKAATRIYDWMVEYKHNAEARKVIFDGARLGVGVIKGPIPESSKAVVVHRTSVPDKVSGKSTVAIAVEMAEQVKPAARWVDPWCFYPAPGCGEDIHKGDHCFEVDPMLPGELLSLGKQQGGHFISEAIDRVIAEGPGKILANAGNQQKVAHKKQFDVWHFRGKIPRAAFEAANAKQASELEQAKDQVDVIATLVNDTVIRAILNPLDSGRLPYHVFCWSRRAGHWAGVGVAEQVRTPQRVLNSASRRMFNNGGQSSGAQVVMDPAAVEPANGEMKITPDKLWWLKPGVSVDDVRKVFAAFEWPNTTQQLMLIIEFALKMFEEHSSIPLITQGQSGKTTPDTFSGQQLQDNNANQLLRDVGFGLNDTVTTPLVDQFYEWLLLDPDVPDGEKGDYKVDTSGALALIEKALRDRTLLAMLGMDPVRMKAFGVDPKKVFQVWARANRMVPSEFQYTEEQQKQIDSQPPPEAPVITAAKIRAGSAEKIAQSHDSLAAQRNQADIDRDTAYNDSLARRDQSAHEARMAEINQRYQIALLEYAKEQRISLQDAKVQLATTTMKLATQEKLAGADGLGPEVATPPDEPPGRAPAGAAYQR